MSLASRVASRAVLAGAAGVFGTLDTAVNVAFPDLLDDFDLGTADLQWVVVFYVLVYGGLLLAAGQLGDAWGYDRVLRTGAVLSTIAIAACAVAPSFEFLLAGRALQGAGAAMVLASAPAMLTSDAPDAPTRAVSIFQAAAALGLAIGPVIGGPLVEWMGWRGVFWFRVPVGLLLVLLTFSVRRQPAGAETRVDRLGAFLVSLALGAAVLALNLAGTRGLGDPIVVASFGVALLLTVGFVQLSNRADQPLLDLMLFRSAEFATANGLAVIANGAMFATWLLVPSLLIDELGVSLLVSGLVLAASPASTAVASWLAGRTSDQHAGWVLAAAGLLFECCAMFALSRVDAAWSALHVAALMGVVGAGLGLFSVPNMAMIMRGVGPNKQGVAAGLSLMTRTVGIVGGVTVASVIAERNEPSRGFIGSFSLVFIVSGAVLGTATIIAAWFATRRQYLQP